MEIYNTKKGQGSVKMIRFTSSQNVTVDVDVDEVINIPMRDIAKEIMEELDQQDLKHLYGEDTHIVNLPTLDGLKLKKFLCEITGQSNHVNTEDLLNELSKRL